MKLAHWLWITGFIVAPIGGWWTAQLSDTSQQQVAASPDELTRCKADLAKLLTAMRASDADAAVENHTRLETQFTNLSAARDAAAAALLQVGVHNVGEAIDQIRDLKQRIAQQTRVAEQSQKVTTQSSAQSDSQGWCIESCLACPAQGTNQAPVAVAPIEPGYVVVCYQ